MKELKNNLEEIFIELRNENSKYSIKILELEQELQKTRDIFKGLVESIYAPYRIGIAVRPNVNWKALNDANELISFFKDKQGE